MGEEKSTNYWWDSVPGERSWVEITDRTDIGADLKCPQMNKAGKTDHSYSLINLIWPGDIVFHYSTPVGGFVGASVAGGPVEQRPIVWTPHSVSARSIKKHDKPVPGWWLPVYGYLPLIHPLELKSLQNPKDDPWIRQWTVQMQATVVGPVEAPFQCRTDGLRAAQGYLAKMPSAFVRRWTSLSDLADELAPVQEKMDRLGEVFTPGKTTGAAVLKLKSEGDYLVAIKAGTQKRTRTHERIVRIAAEWLKAHNADPTTPHPVDLQITAPKKVIFEVKPIEGRGSLFAVREAVGQLFEYRYFQGPQDAMLCVLLDGDPGVMLVEYLEESLGIGICWLNGAEMIGGPKTSEQLSCLMQASKAAAHAG